MKPYMKKLLVVGLVIALAVAVFAMAVGFKAAADDVGVQSDPTGQDRPPIAYAVINCEGEVQNLLGSIQPRMNWVSVDVYDYAGAARVYTTEKWDPDILGWYSDDVRVYVTMQIAGPGNYISSWKSEVIEDNIPELASAGDTHVYEFGPYTANFYDPGEYTLTVKLVVECDSEDVDPPSVMTKKFTVEG